MSGRQPPAGTPLNRFNPILRDALYIKSFAGIYIPDETGHGMPSVVDQVQGLGSIGGYIDCTGVSGDYFDSGYAPPVVPGADYTVMVLVRTTHTGALVTLMSCTDALTGVPWNWLLTTGGKVYLQCGAGTGDSVQWDGAPYTTATDGDWHLLSITSTFPDNPTITGTGRLYVDGVEDSRTDVQTVTPTGTPANIAVGNAWNTYPTTNDEGDIDVAFAGVWNRKLSAAEQASLGRDLWQLFKPQRIFVPLVPNLSPAPLAEEPPVGGSKSFSSIFTRHAQHGGARTPYGAFTGKGLAPGSAIGSPSITPVTASGAAELIHTANSNTTIKMDTFDEASDTPLESHTSNTGGGWQGTTTDKITVEASTDTATAELANDIVTIGDENPTNTDYFVEVEATLGALTANNRIGVVSRGDAGANIALTVGNYYSVRIFGHAGWSFQRQNDGNQNTLDSDVTWLADNGLDGDDPIRIKLALSGINPVSYEVWLDFNKDAAGWGGYQLVGSGTDAVAERIQVPGNVGLFLSDVNARLTYLNAQYLSPASASIPAITSSGTAERKVVAAGGVPGSLKDDTFTETTDTLLSAHTSESGGGWQGAKSTWLTVDEATDEIKVTTGSTLVTAIGDEDSANPDCIVEIEGTVGGTGEADRIGLIARANDGATFNFGTSDFYVWYQRGAGSNTFWRYTGATSQVFAGPGFFDDNALDVDDPIRMKLKIWGSGDTTRYELWYDYNKDGAGWLGYKLGKSGVDDVGVGGFTPAANTNVGVYMEGSLARITSLNSERIGPFIEPVTATGVSEVIRKANGSAPIQSDTFTEASDTALSAHTSDSGGGWQGVDLSQFNVLEATDEVENTINGTSQHGVLVTAPTSSDYSAEVEGTVGVTGGNVFGAVCRGTDGAAFDAVGVGGSSWYGANIHGTSGWQLWRVIPGESVAALAFDTSWLADNGIDGDDPIRIRLTTSGTGASVRLKVEVDANIDAAGFTGWQTVADIEDTSTFRITSAGQPGFYMANVEPRITSFSSTRLGPAIPRITSTSVAEIIKPATGATSISPITSEGVAEVIHVAEAAVKVDTFTEGSDTGLELHTSDSSGGWQGVNTTGLDVISATGEVRVASGGLFASIGDENPTNPDYTVEIEGITGGPSGSDQFGLVARAEDGDSFDPQSSNYYVLKFLAASGWTLDREIGGTPTTLANDFSYWTNEGLDSDDPIRLKLEISGTGATVTLKVFIDYNKDGAGFSGYGAAVATFGDTHANRIVAANNVGIYLNQVNTRVTSFNSPYAPSAGATISAVTASGLGKVPFKADGSPSITAVTSEGTGKVPFKADGSPSITAVTSEGAAEVIKTADGSPSIEAITSEGVAERINTADGSPSISSITSEGTGLPIRAANGSPSISPITAEGVGEVIRTANGAPEISSITSTSSAEVIRPADGAASIQPITAAGASEVIRTASGSPSISPITSEGTATKFGAPIKSYTATYTRHAQHGGARKPYGSFAGKEESVTKTANGSPSITPITSTGAAEVIRTANGSPSITPITSTGTAATLRTADGSPSIAAITAEGIAERILEATGSPSISPVIANGAGIVNPDESGPTVIFGGFGA